MPFRPSRLASLAVAGLFLVGASACSDDSSDDATGTGDADPAADTNSGTDAGGGDEEGRPFGVAADGMATAMQSGTGADRVEVDGTTFRLHFDEGSVEDVAAHINCSAMGHLKGDGDVIIMVYPDGDLACDEI